MRLIFGSLISILIVCYYGVESVELRCPCGSNGLRNPLSGVFLVGRDPPRPPGCTKHQHYLVPPNGRRACLNPDHHLSKWLDAQNSNSWYKVVVTTGGGGGPHVDKKAEIKKRLS
ncbi:chemokine vCXCL1 [Human betaherpesvirus 5]|uniref:UL146 n=1 Tax=Human cytomegalovirus TaxID=10359 RepID=Q2IAJ4_HCMV|nr:UL146 [Human betaherpesvirus 5]AAZ91726.1 UL146 [Human betaherpesvirus 5]AAZ91733.1 UL146 [Human betaherpesvirus 5]ABA02080.1 UL146 [Human betaherpesvirus 5]ABA02146.1 UL146 [Human betaherpesvirus 5]